jgi:hypothetical protein
MFGVLNDNNNNDKKNSSSTTTHITALLHPSSTNTQMPQHLQGPEGGGAIRGLLPGVNKLEREGFHLGHSVRTDGAALHALVVGRERLSDEERAWRRAFTDALSNNEKYPQARAAADAALLAHRQDAFKAAMRAIHAPARPQDANPWDPAKRGWADPSRALGFIEVRGADPGQGDWLTTATLAPHSTARQQRRAEEERQQRQQQQQQQQPGNPQQQAGNTQQQQQQQQEIQQRERQRQQQQITVSYAAHRHARGFVQAGRHLKRRLKRAAVTRDAVAALPRPWPTDCGAQALYIAAATPLLRAALALYGPLSAARRRLRLYGLRQREYERLLRQFCAAAIRTNLPIIGQRGAAVPPPALPAPQLSVIGIGNANIGHHTHLSRPGLGPTKDFVKTARRSHLTRANNVMIVGVSECGTSLTCFDCVERTLERFDAPTMGGAVRRRGGYKVLHCTKCRRFWQRDVVSGNNDAALIAGELLGLPRPTPFKRGGGDDGGSDGDDGYHPLLLHVPRRPRGQSQQRRPRNTAALVSAVAESLGLDEQIPEPMDVEYGDRSLGGDGGPGPSAAGAASADGSPPPPPAKPRKKARTADDDAAAAAGAAAALVVSPSGAAEAAAEAAAGSPPPAGAPAAGAPAAAGAPPRELRGTDYSILSGTLAGSRGSCMFVSAHAGKYGMAHQPLVEDVRRLRAAVVARLKHKLRVGELDPGAFEANARSVGKKSTADYLHAMQYGDEWGGEAELNALAELLHCRFAVYRRAAGSAPGGSGERLRLVDVVGSAGDQQIVYLRHSGDDDDEYHYDLIRRF